MTQASSPAEEWVQPFGSARSIMENTRRLYTDLAWLWPMWGDPAGEYAQYCRHVAGLIGSHATHPARTLLDIGTRCSRA